MINPRRQHQQIPRLRSNPYPPVARVAHVKETVPIPDVPDFLVLVHVLVEEHFDLILICRAHGAGRHGDFVAVGVVAGFGEVFEVGRRRGG